MKNEIKFRIKTNWVTTIIGFILIIFSCVLLYQGKISMMDLQTWIQFVFAVFLVWVKDSVIGLKKKEK